MTTSFCVVGSPIEQSLSPVLHTAAYKHLGLDFAYGKNEVPAGGLRNFLSSSDLSGVSVTMPLKVEAFALAASHDQDSLTTGVSNTLVRSTGGWRGFNTDVYGISQALSDVSEPRNTLVIGSGATARSGLVALAKLFSKTEVQLVSRKIGQSDEPRSGILFDVAYNPWPSKPALAWDSSKVISGVEMLIWQAIEQVQLFVSATGIASEIDRSALYSAMKAAVSHK